MDRNISDTMDDEYWLPITFYPHNEKYEVSSMGRVRSKTKDSYTILPFLKDKGGYLRVTMNKNRIILNRCVHRLVALAFIPNPENKPQVNHKYGIKDDNRVSQLEWVTRSENEKHAHKMGLKSNKGAKNSLSKLTEKEVLEIYSSNLSVMQLAEKYRVTDKNIYSIKSGKNWSHLTASAKKEFTSKNPTKEVFYEEIKYSTRQLSEKLKIKYGYLLFNLKRGFSVVECISNYEQLIKKRAATINSRTTKWQKIKCDTLDMYFESSYEADEILGVGYKYIRECCDNKRLHHNGLSFRYI